MGAGPSFRHAPEGACLPLPKRKGGGAVARESRWPGWAVPARAGPGRVGLKGSHTWPLQAGRAVSWLCYAVAQVFAFLPYSSRRDQRGGRGAERGAWAQAVGGDRMLLVARLLPGFPWKGAQGLPKPKGPLPWLSCSGGIREGRGSWPFSPRGRAAWRSTKVTWAGPCRYGVWLAQAEG